MIGERRSDQPSAFEMFEESLLMITGIAVSAPMLPGFLLCVPFLVSVTVVALLPVVAVGLVAGAVALVVAIPVLLVRSAAGLRTRLMSRAVRRAPSLATEMSTGIATVVARHSSHDLRGSRPAH